MVLLFAFQHFGRGASEQDRFDQSIVQRCVFYFQVGAVIGLLVCSCRPAREPNRS